MQVAEDDRLSSILMREVPIPIEAPKQEEEEQEVPPEDEEAY